MKDNKIFFAGIILIILLLSPSISLAGNIIWGGGEAESGFEINPEAGKYYCSDEAGKWGWHNGDFIGWDENGYECNRDESEVGPVSIYPCCPPNMACNESSGKCYTPPIEKEFCYEYETESTCENAPITAATNELKEIKINDSSFTCDGDYGFNKDSTYVSVKQGSCRCNWDDGNSTCTATYDTIRMTMIGSDSNSLEEIKCYMPNVKIENCSEGQKGMRTISWTWYYKNDSGNKIECSINDDCDGYYSADGEKLICHRGKGLCKSSICQSGQRTSPCVSGALLGFIDAISIAIAIMLIIVFYIIVVKKKKSKKK